MFEQLKAMSAAKVEEMQASLPDKIVVLDTQVGQMQAKGLDEVERTFAKLVVATKPVSNAELAKLCTIARAEAMKCVNDLRAVERFITLHIPKVEDGNNFGVAIQLEMLKNVAERGKTLKSAIDALPTYRKDRAAAWGGVAPKTTTDASATKTSSNDDEVKAGKEEKTSKAGASKTETTKTTSAAPLEDAVAHIVDLDVARYIELAYLLETARDAYIFVGDALEKNKEKITKPKGDGANAMSMF